MLINHWELLAVLFAVQGFLPSLQGQLVALYAENTTALAYLKKEGGTQSQTLNSVAQAILLFYEVHRIQLLPQTPSVHSGQTECASGFLELQVASPWLQVDSLLRGFPPASSSLASDNRPLRHVSEPPPSGVLFARGRPPVSSQGCHAPVLCLSPLWPDPSVPGQGSAVQGSGAHVGSSVLDATPLIPGPSGASGGDSLLPATKEGSSQTTAFPSLPPEPPRASAACISFVERSARHFGFSKAVLISLPTTVADLPE